MSFSIVITSDPQYPWYDPAPHGYPPGVSKDDQADNSLAQINGQYTSINQLVATRKSQSNGKAVKAVIVNGDLTAFGHGSEMAGWTGAAEKLTVDMYPALGNHDYANNVGDTFNDRAASGMVDYMWNWLRTNQPRLSSHDFTQLTKAESKTFIGSLAYSFQIGPVHIVMLQNYPYYVATWSQITVGGTSRDYQIKSSATWLEADLYHARTRGDAILVFTHSYNDVDKDHPENVFHAGPQLDAFRGLMAEYGVSAVFVGHIHPVCDLIDTIDPNGAKIPVFRSGGASQQDYMLADFTFEPTASMTVTKCDGKTAPASSEKEKYVNVHTWPPVPLVMTGRRVIAGGRFLEGDMGFNGVVEDPAYTWGVSPDVGCDEVSLGSGYGWNRCADPPANGYCQLFARTLPPDTVAAGTLVIVGGYALLPETRSINLTWGTRTPHQQQAGQLTTWVDSQGTDQLLTIYWCLAPWDPDAPAGVFTGGEQQQFDSTMNNQVGTTSTWGYQVASGTEALVAVSRTWVEGVDKAIATYKLYCPPATAS